MSSRRSPLRTPSGSTASTTCRRRSWPLQFDAVATDIGIDAAKTGMLATSEIIRVVAGKIRQYGIVKLVVDPVMVAKGGMSLIREEAKKTLIAELIPLAFVLTPNIPEAEVLSGHQDRDA